MEYIINPLEVRTGSYCKLGAWMDEDEFNEVVTLLRRSYNLDFSKYKLASVGRRIRRRMDFLNIAKTADYVSILSGDRDELEALYKDLLIGVTEFFRDPQAFKYLQSDIIPKLFANLTPGEDLRAWSADCATGEEAYSLVINDNLDTSIIEAGKMKLEASPFNLRHVVGGVIDRLSSQARKKGLRFDHDYPSGLPHRFIGDPERIKQTLVNLVGNAVKFTEEGYARVAVSCVQNNGGPVEVTVSVEDSGPGIPDDKLQILFQKVSQLSLDPSKNSSGTGLGLAISKQLVEMMGGRIGVDTKAGEGSKFWFMLPLPVHDEPESKGDNRLSQKMLIAAIQPLVTAGFNRCLLVDDYIMNRQLFGMIMEKYGFKIEMASNGLEAVEISATHPFDLVFMDCRMPVMDGFEATRLIREREGDAQRSTIIALTANVSPENSRQCFEAGMDDYLSKPVDLQHLYRTLITWAEQKKRQEPLVPENPPTESA